MNEQAWLLEKLHNGEVHYITANNVLEWTNDPLKALRLARREDAEMLATIIEDCEKIASHEWVGPRTVWTMMEQPGYPATCTKCGLEGTNESLHNHECDCP